MFQPDLPMFYFIRFQPFGWLSLYKETIIGDTNSGHDNWIYIGRDGRRKTGAKFCAVACANYLPALPVNSISSWPAWDGWRFMVSIFPWHTIVKPIKPSGRVVFKVGFIYPAAFERLFPHNCKIVRLRNMFTAIQYKNRRCLICLNKILFPMTLSQIQPQTLFLKQLIPFRNIPQGGFAVKAKIKYESVQ